MAGSKLSMDIIYMQSLSNSWQYDLKQIKSLSFNITWGMVYLFVCYSLFLIYRNVITSYRRTSQFDILHTWRRFFFVPTSFAE